MGVLDDALAHFQRERFGACISPDVSGGDCTRQQSNRVLSKIHVCCLGQNQMVCKGRLHCEVLVLASAVTDGQLHYVTEQNFMVLGHGLSKTPA